VEFFEEAVEDYKINSLRQPFFLAGVRSEYLQSRSADIVNLTVTATLLFLLLFMLCSFSLMVFHEVKKGKPYVKIMFVCPSVCDIVYLPYYTICHSILNRLSDFH
jgi:hypothetical protein